MACWPCRHAGAFLGLPPQGFPGSVVGVWLADLCPAPASQRKNQSFVSGFPWDPSLFFLKTQLGELQLDI